VRGSLTGLFDSSECLSPRSIPKETKWLRRMDPCAWGGRLMSPRAKAVTATDVVGVAYITTIRSSIVVGFANRLDEDVDC
jgi:hypothetical protein